METIEAAKTLNFSQEKILEAIKQKMNSFFSYDLPWGEYGDYGDYNDCHGDYYDADYQ